jgi:hypothetical protein
MSSEFMRAINQKQNIFSQLRLHFTCTHCLFLFGTRKLRLKLIRDKNKPSINEDFMLNIAYYITATSIFTIDRHTHQKIKEGNLFLFSFI